MAHCFIDPERIGYTISREIDDSKLLKLRPSSDFGLISRALHAIDKKLLEDYPRLGFRHFIGQVRYS